MNPFAADAAGEVSYIYRTRNGKEVADKARTVPSSAQHLPLPEEISFFAILSGFSTVRFHKVK